MVCYILLSIFYINFTFLTFFKDQKSKGEKFFSEMSVSGEHSYRDLLRRLKTAVEKKNGGVKTKKPRRVRILLSSMLFFKTHNDDTLLLDNDIVRTTLSNRRRQEMNVNVMLEIIFL